MPSDQSLLAFAERERARLANERMMADGIPPLDFIPQATPVGALKNRTALQNQYTPEATNILEQTPVNISYAQDPKIEEATGHYNFANTYWRPSIESLGIPPGGINVEAYSRPVPDQEGTLAHEFAHKWQDQVMSPEASRLWNIAAPQVATDYAKGRVANDYGTLPTDLNGMELYANAVEQGPWNIPEELLNTHYGMYMENPQAPPPMAPPMSALPQTVFNMPDLRSLREQYFGAANWVPEQNVDGYDSRGNPIRNPKLGIPTIFYQSPAGSPYYSGEVRGG